MNKEIKYDIRVLRCNMCGRVWERDDDPFAPQCCPNCSASNTTTERIIPK